MVDEAGIPGTAPAVRISVCYARPGDAFLKELEVPPGTTIVAAIAASGLLQACPEVDPATMRVGIFSKLKTPDTLVRAGDRIEVYRPLVADPKSARNRRVQKTRKGGTREGLKWLRGG
uniref:RnfH family protein n=1 Tax=Cupriavidus ulmosensis TaxID=3065913 RepID=UPI003F876CFD